MCISFWYWSYSSYWSCRVRFFCRLEPSESKIWREESSDWSFAWIHTTNASFWQLFVYNYYLRGLYSPMHSSAELWRHLRHIIFLLPPRAKVEEVPTPPIALPSCRQIMLLSSMSRPSIRLLVVVVFDTTIPYFQSITCTYLPLLLPLSNHLQASHYSLVLRIGP